MVYLPSRRSAFFAPSALLIASGGAQAKDDEIANPFNKSTKIALNVDDEAFGGAGRGDDDTDAIQKCIDAAADDGVKLVKFPPSIDGYKISRTIIVPPRASRLTLQGYGEASRIHSSNTPIAFEVRSTLVHINHLSFYGMRGDKSLLTTALRFKKIHQIDDMDVFVTKCSFAGYNEAIEHWGRGLFARENLFVTCDRGITFNWMTSAEPDPGDTDLQKLPLGFRNIIVCDNHAHAVSQFLTNRSSHPIYGGKFNQNHLDVGRGFWSGAATLSQFKDNIVLNCSKTPLNFPTSGSFIDISGIYGGLSLNSPSDGSIYQPDNVIVFSDKRGVTGVRVDAHLVGFRTRGFRVDADLRQSQLRLICEDPSYKKNSSSLIYVRGDVVDTSIELAAQFQPTTNVSGVEISGNVVRSSVCLNVPATSIVIGGAISNGSRVGH